MARSAARLTMVAGAPGAACEPEEVLASLFAREATLLAELRLIRERLPDARARYAERRGLTLMLPGIETLRRLFGPKAGRP